MGVGFAVRLHPIPTLALPLKGREVFLRWILICIDLSSFLFLYAACWEQNGRLADG